MITRLIFRVSVLVVVLMGVSIGTTGWVGTRTPSIVYVAYHEGYFLVNDRESVSIPLEIPYTPSDIVVMDWLSQEDGLYYIAMEQYWCNYHFNDGTTCTAMPGYDPYFERLSAKISPDGNYFSFADDYSVWVQQLSGMDTVASYGEYSYSRVADWLYDSRHVIIADYVSLIVLDVVTGERTVIQTEDQIIHNLQASPTEMMIAYRFGYANTTVKWLDLETQEIIQTITLNQGHTLLRWSPNGEKLLATDDTQLHILTPNHILTWQLNEPFDTLNNFDLVHWGDDNISLYYICQEVNLCVMNTDTGDIEIIFTQESPDYAIHAIGDAVVLLKAVSPFTSPQFLLWYDGEIHTLRPDSGATYVILRP